MLAPLDGTEFVRSLAEFGYFFCECAESEQLRRCLKCVFLPNESWMETGVTLLLENNFQRVIWLAHGWWCRGGVEEVKPFPFPPWWHPPLTDPNSFFLKTLSIFIWKLSCPHKEHTHCVFLWFTFQFRPYEKWPATFLPSVFIVI